MQSIFRVAIVGLILFAASLARAEVTIISAQMDIFAGSVFGDEVLSDTASGPFTFNSSVGGPAPIFTSASIDASASGSSIRGSGSVTVNADEFGAAINFLGVNFATHSPTRLVASYIVDASAGLDSRITLQQSGQSPVFEDVALGNTVIRSGRFTLPAGGVFSLIADSAGPVGGSTFWDFDLRFFDTGVTQADPMLPTGLTLDGWEFNDVPGDSWFDPVMADGFEFEMLSESEFTVAGMPVGLGDPDGYTLSYLDGLTEVLVYLNEGETYNFPAGVGSFKVLGINPNFDPEDPLAFPIYLDFSTPLADFTMTPLLVPEPATLLLLALGACILPALQRSRNRVK